MSWIWQVRPIEEENVKKLIFKDILKNVVNFTDKNSPAILTGVGIACMVSGTIFAVKTTPKVLKLLEEKKEEQKVEKLETVEVIKTSWKYYIPTAILEGAAITCFIGSLVINNKRYAALALAYGVSETALKEYQDKVIETVGEGKEKKIRDNIAEEHLKKNPDTAAEVIQTGKGDTLCYDELSGRYFRSDIEKVRKAVNDVNRKMLEEDYVLLNELYYELNMPPIKIGNLLGWHIDRGYVDVSYSSILAESGNPCLVLGFRNPPYYDYK